MSTSTNPASASVNRRGISLLEVLVACGLLVIALASIAALLPAAGTRLSQAALADRSGVLAANAYAEVMSRGLLSAALYSGTTAAGAAIAAPPAAYAFGRMTDRIVISNATTGAKGKGRGKKMTTTGTGGLPGLAAPQEDSLYSLIDFDRGFSLEDELELQAATVGEVPLSPFTNGYRSFRDGLCWGAMLSVTGSSVASGTPAELSIVIFKKEGSVSTDADADNGVPITLAGPFPLYTLDEAARQSYLQACSYVLVLPPSAGQLPRWAKVTASWPSDAATGRGSVVLDVDGAYAAAQNLQVVGFQTIVRVDTYSVVLE